MAFSFTKTNGQTDYVLDGVTHILTNTFAKRSGSQYSFSFPKLVKIQQRALNSKTLGNLTLGENFSKITENCMNVLTVGSLIFEADTVEISDTFKVKCNSISPPKHFILSSDSIMFDLQSPMTCSLNTSINNYTIKDDEIILSDEKYEQIIIISSQSNIFNLTIESTVRYIGLGFFDSISFGSVTINSGIETLLSLISATDPFTIPASVTNILFYSYSPSHVTIDSGTTMVLENDFLMTQSTTELLGCYNTADITKLPTSVTKLGPYSLNNFTAGDEYVTPTHITHISEYALPSTCTSLILSSVVVSLMHQSSINNCSFIPRSVEYIDYDFLTGLAYPIVVSEGCSALSLINGVWYHIDEETSYTTAVAVQDPNAESIDFEYDKILSYCIDSINNETLRFITNKHKHSSYASGSNFAFFERLSARIRNFWDFDYNRLYLVNTNFTGKLRVPVKSSTIDGITTYSCAHFSHYSIPYGVLHLYAAYKPEEFEPQPISPWIHVPPNSSLTYSDFGGFPLIYDWVKDSDADDDDYVDESSESSDSSEEDSSKDFSGNSNSDNSGNDSSGSENIIEKNTKDLSSGAIAGIVIACIVFIALIAFLIFYCFVYRKVNDKSSSEEGAAKTEVEAP